MNDDAIEFIKGIEDALGAPISWRTFATYYASTDGTVREYGVFLCRAGDDFYLEDFDRQPTMLGIPLSVKDRGKYEKYSRRFRVDSVLSANRVARKDAEMQARLKTPSPLPESGKLSKAFSKQVTQLVLTSGECLYFELIDHKEILKEISK